MFRNSVVALRSAVRLEYDNAIHSYNTPEFQTPRSGYETRLTSRSTANRVRQPVKLVLTQTSSLVDSIRRPHVPFK